MAPRTFANAKLLSATILDGLSNSLTRRGYAAAAATQSATTKGGVVSSMSGGGGKMTTPKKSGEEKGASKVSWVPDPVTGYYKPENTNEIIDVADLRATLLRKKFNN